MTTDISIRYTGDTESDAVAIHKALGEVPGLTIGEPQARDTEPLAPLGLGTVVLTMIAVAAVKRFLKVALERLEQYLQAPQPKDHAGATVVIWIEDPVKKERHKFTIIPEDEPSTATRVLKELQAFANEL